MSAYDDENQVDNNGMQGTKKAGPGTAYSGVRAGTSNDDPNINYWTGSATPAQMAAAQSAGTTATGPAANVNSAQNGLLAQLQAQSAGQGPSVAQMELQKGTQANIRGAAALAASGRSPGVSAYNAAQGATAANQQAAGQSALARLQEQYQAQQGLAGLSGQMAGQQQQLNEFNAGQGQQNNQFNAQQQQNQNQFYNTMMGSQTGQTNQYLENKDIARTNNNAQLVNNVLSDKRMKTKIKPGKKMLDEFFEKRGKAACY